MTTATRQFLLDLPARMREEDKQKHLWWSFWMTLVAVTATGVLTGFTLVMLIGLAKEVWDEFFGSGFCRFDLLANLLGALPAVPLGLALFLSWQAS